MSETPKGKIFGFDISPEDISLGTDGSVIINKPELVQLVKSEQLKIAKELLGNSSRDIPPPPPVEPMSICI